MSRNNVGISPVINDLQVENGKVVRVSGADYTAQLLTAKLRMNLGSWIHEQTLGLPWITYIFRKGASIDLIQAMIRDTAEQCPGISSAPQVTITGVGRQLRIEITAYSDQQEPITVQLP